MHFLRNITFLFTIAAVTACSNTATLPAPVAMDSNYAFETPGNFIVGIAQNDAGQASSLYAIQQGKSFIILRTDTEDSILCSNLENTSSCVSKTNKVFTEDEKNKIIRVATQSVQRILSREVSLKDTSQEISTTQPKFTTSDPSKIPPSLSKYFPLRSEETAEQCATLSKTDEKELVCYWKNIMPFYRYVETTDVPVSSLRALFAYKEQDLSPEEMKQLYESMKTDAVKN